MLVCLACGHVETGPINFQPQLTIKGPYPSPSPHTDTQTQPTNTFQQKSTTAEATCKYLTKNRAPKKKGTPTGSPNPKTPPVTTAGVSVSCKSFCSRRSPELCSKRSCASMTAEPLAARTQRLSRWVDAFV